MIPYQYKYINNYLVMKSTKSMYILLKNIRYATVSLEPKLSTNKSYKAVFVAKGGEVPL
jgi:hypothetical protein